MVSVVEVGPVAPPPQDASASIPSGQLIRVGKDLGKVPFLSTLHRPASLHPAPPGKQQLPCLEGSVPEGPGSCSLWAGQDSKEDPIDSEIRGLGPPVRGKQKLP